MINLRRELAGIAAIAALLFAAGPAFAQAPAGTPEQPAALVMIAKIDSKLSTRNAKVGDVFSAKILKSWKLTDGTEIPKGSKITGKVALVKSKKEGDGTSTLSFKLDTIEVKGGAPVPVHAAIVAIGPSLAPKDGLGPNSVLGRSASSETGGMGANTGRGVGSTPGLNPNAGLGGAIPRDDDDIPLGSTQPGVSLGRHLDADWTTILQGVHQEIDLDSEVLIKVQLK
jgi:hypothetical protein